jgi:hypothetical protein
MREFSTGATRDIDDGKLDYEGFLNPFVLKRYAEYLHNHRVQADGQLRASDNWQLGIPKEVYAKSLNRHHMELWLQHRSTVKDRQLMEESLCGIIFNSMGYLLEMLKEKE